MIYYHGTHSDCIHDIATQGFKVGEQRTGRVLGNGVYIASELKTVFSYGFDYVFQCELQPSTRILWIERDVDVDVIAYLKREFGKDITEVGPNIHKVMPQNKQLTKKELIAFVTWFFYSRTEKWNKSWRYWGCWSSLSRLYKHIRRHGYNAVGDRSWRYWDSDQVMVFEPHRVKPLTCHRISYVWPWGAAFCEKATLGPALTMEQLKNISDREKADIKSWELAQKD